MEVRKREFICQLDQIAQQKLKTLATQRDQINLVQAQLSSCLNFVKESLQIGSKEEILAMKKPVVKQVEEITAEFKAAVLVPQDQEDFRGHVPKHASSLARSTPIQSPQRGATQQARLWRLQQLESRLP